MPEKQNLLKVTDHGNLCINKSVNPEKKLENLKNIIKPDQEKKN